MSRPIGVGLRATKLRAPGRRRLLVAIAAAVACQETNPPVDTLTVSVAINPENAGTATGPGTYDDGAKVTLSATAAEPFDFAAWQENGSTVASTPTYEFTIASDRSFVARFIAKVPLAVTGAGAGNGSVTGPGISCTLTAGVTSGDCLEAYRPLTDVTLTPIPAAGGYTFGGWTGACTGTGACTVTMTEARAVTASFALPTYTVATSAIPPNGGATTGGGTYTSGTTATVEAAPAAGYSFGAWTENDTTVATTATYSFPVNRNRSLVARFLANTQLTVTGAGAGGGSVSGPGIACTVLAGAVSGDCTEEYPPTATVSLSATPTTGGHSFTGWSGACSGAAQCSVAMTQSRAVTANFAPPSFTVITSASPANGGTTTGAGTFPVGTTVTVTATANPGFAFLEWTENGAPVATTATYAFPLQSNRTLVARFSSNPVLTIKGAGGNGQVSGTGIACTITAGNPGGDCTESYPPSTTVTLTAAPAVGYSLVAWEENGTAVSATPTYAVTMTASRTITARFVANPLLTVTGAGLGNGGVAAPGINCTIAAGVTSGDCTESYAPSTVVTLTATPAAGNHAFQGWSGACTGPTCQVVMDQPRSVIATFTINVAARIHGFGFGPFIDGQDGRTATIDATQVRTRMLLVAPYVEWIRGFGSSRGVQYVGQVAHQLGKKVACGAYLTGNANANSVEITNLIASAQAGECDLLVVGNEVLHQGYLSAQALIGHIRQVKAAVALPVTTAETYDKLIENPSVMSEVDVVFANFYPFWEGYLLPDAVGLMHQRHQQLVALSGKKVVVSETGWPSAGSPIMAAVPSPTNASTYFATTVSWAKAKGIEYFYFQALDEQWKLIEGDFGPHWGVFDKSGSLKPGMQPVFDGTLVADTWSGTTVVGGPRPTPTTKLLSFTQWPAIGATTPLYGTVQHVAPNDYRVAVFIRVAGLWYTKPTYADSVTVIAPSGRWRANVTTGGGDVNATEIAAFLLKATLKPATVQGQGAIPTYFYSVADDSVRILRP